MSLILSGTDGLSDIDGSAATPAIRGTDTNTGIFFPAADTIAFAEGGVESMRIDSAGNVGIGTTSPTASSSNRTLTLNGPATFGSLIDFKTNETLNFRIFSGVSNSVLSVKTATPLLFDTNDIERMRIDASGNVGIGTTSPSNRVSIVTASGSDGIVSVKSPTTETAGILIDGGSTSNKGALLTLAKDGTTKWRIGLDSAIGGGTNNNLNILGSSTDALLFGTNGTERARITSTGNLLVGTTSAGFSNSNAITIQAAEGYCVLNHANGTGSGTNYIWFGYNAGSIGTISQNGTTAVAYNTTSDYRLKNTVAPMTGALDKVAQLKPVTYKWNADGSDGQGFIAHELAAVCPDAVCGAKDAVDADGNPQYQGIDTSFLVATLTAAIQEQQALIQSLKARLDAANL